MHMRRKSLYALCGVVSLFLSNAWAQPRETLNLDGVWDFATDLDNQGEVEKWFQPGTVLPAMPLPGYAPTANGKIVVPGVWDNQGYGTATDKVRHNFVGKGWYKRQIEIPSTWAVRHIFLDITGVSRYAKVWINGRLLGEHIGFLSIQEYDLTAYVTPGTTAELTIQVDSKQRWEIDSMYGTCSLADYMDVAWGGIWGHVFLEARARAWLSDLFVQPNVSDSSCSVSATFNGAADSVDGARLEVVDSNGQRIGESALAFDVKPTPGQPVNVTALMPSAALWTPDTPILYTARMSLLKGGDVIDAIESRFGMRKFTVDGCHILLNGKRLMLRGHGDDHVYPEQMAMPSDKELYLARLRLAKSYGFNFVRNHSAIMPPEYYDACDEVGMIVTAEFPICYHIYLPGTGYMWLAHALPGTDPAPANETYIREWTASIVRYRNHPSIFCWARGNELYDEHPHRAEFQAIARQHDPTRLYIDSDSVSPQVLDPANDRDTLDFYTVPFNESTNPLENPTKYQMAQAKKPVIVHEAGNYVTFSRPDLIDAFKHNFKPFWLTTGKAKLLDLGLLGEADQWAEKSERLYALCNKFNTEAMRRNPFICGYQWWNFQDYWCTSNGIVDHYFRPKSISREEVLKYNNDVVLLQDGLDRTYRAGDRFNMTLFVSNYSAGELLGELEWEVTMGGQPIGKQQVALNPVPQGDVAEITRVALDLPQTDSPVKVAVTANILSGEKRFANDWSTWLYPAEIKPVLSATPVFADATQLERLNEWGVAPIAADGVLNERAVYVTGQLSDTRLIDAMERGACVVLLGDLDPALPSTPLTYKPSWWHGTTNGQINHAGTFVYGHPVTRAMAPDGWCDDGWLHLIQGSRRYSLENAPSRPNIIIRALPTLELVDEQALLFEVGVENGCLIASGLNHLEAQARPENQWLLARLLEYAATFPQPQAQWPASFLGDGIAAP